MRSLLSKWATPASTRPRWGGNRSPRTWSLHTDQYTDQYTDQRREDGSPSADATELLPSRCFHEIFEVQAARTPNACAVVWENERLTYAELNARANRVAHALQARGVGPEVLVGICLERSPALIVGILAILKAGGAYVPFDPTYPDERLAYMLADSQVPVLMTQDAQLQRFAGYEGCVVACATAASAANADHVMLDSANPQVPLVATHLAYVIYTSGSTGQPKGVMVTHQGLENLGAALRDGFAVDATSRVLQFASPSFDAIVAELTMTFSSGATLYLAPSRSLLPGPNLVDFLRAHAITHLTIAPSALAALPPAAATALPTLRTLIVAGEACPASLAARWAPGRRFVNAYGPTELTVCATLGVCDAADVANGAPPSIGRPIANTEAYVLDAHLQPVPVGVVGELYLGGRGLARGYLGRPELTRERFVPHPFRPEAGARLYQTGDLVRWRPDGQLDFLGRADDQIKLRGHRIEPEEIASRLRSQPGVIQCVVIAREDVPGDRRLVAYVVPDSSDSASQSLSPHTLRRALAEQLPAYLVPSAVVTIDALPLTPNGKLDRTALPAPRRTREHHDASETDTIYMPPRDALETVLAELWAEMLNEDRAGIEPLGVFDDFTEWGGDSLLAAQVSSRMQQLLGVDVNPGSVLELGTVAHVAEALCTKPGARQHLECRAQTILQVASLTDDEVAQMLAESSARAASAPGVR